MTGRFHEEQGVLEGSGGRLLAWTRPVDEGPHPAVLLLPPLGARSSTLPLDECASTDGLGALTRSCAQAGFVTLRLSAEPSGGPSAADLDAEIADARAALDALRDLTFVDPAGLFVFGWSLGGALAPLVARGRHVQGVITYGATSRTWSECLADGARRQLAFRGLPGPELEREARAAERLYRLLLHGDAVAQELLREHPELSRSLAAGDVRGETLHGRPVAYFRALERVDPAEAWREVDCAVLALRGEHDWIIAEDDHERIAAWARSTGRDATAAIVAGIDHDSMRRTSVGDSWQNRGTGLLDDGLARMTVAWMRDRYTAERRPR